MNALQLKQQILEITKNNKKQVVVLFVCIAVLLLLCVSDLFPEKENLQTEDEIIQTFEKATEEKLEHFLSHVAGVGKVKVCVTLESMSQYEYASDLHQEMYAEKNKEEKEYIIIENAQGDESGLRIFTKAPEIRGVAVCCEGGNSAKVKNEVTMLLAASLNLPTNRIYISAYSDHN